jgi:hypothetical protein
MHRSALIFALAAAVLAPAPFAQSPAPAPTPTTPACPPSATLEQLPKALDDAISGPGDKDRTCLRQLLLPEVRLVLVTGAAPRILTLDGWIEAVQKRGSVDLFERQVKVRTETFGRIAQLWSTYEIRPTPDGKATTRGINSIQAIFDGERWRVVQVLWQAETPSESIPEKYLP